MSRPLNLIRRDFVHWLDKVDARGWTANHDGNLSLKLGGGRWLATPTSFSKGEIKEQDLLVINSKAQVISGRHRIFSEIKLHQRCYAVRPDVNVVLHAHPPTATSFAVGKDLEQAYLRMELCEHLARIQMGAVQLGGVRLIPEADVSRLLQKRAKAGLGPGARGLEVPAEIHSTAPASRMRVIVGPCSGPVTIPNSAQS